MARAPDPTARCAIPVAGDPNRLTMRPPFPVPLLPSPAIVVICPIAADPHMLRTWRDADNFLLRSRRFGGHNDCPRCRNRFSDDNGPLVMADKIGRASC